MANDDTVRVVFDAVDRGKGVRDGVDRHTQGVAENSVRMTERIRLGWLAIAGGVTMALAAITKGAQRLQEITPVRQAFESLSRSIGSTADVMIGKLRPATLGLMTDFNLMKQLNQAVALGVATDEQQMSKLTSSAVKLGRALGLDVNYAMQSLVTGIGRQSRLFLDNLGIIVNADKAYEAYAKTVGKTASALSEQERKAAFTAAAMEALDRTVAKLGDQQESAGDKMARAWTRVQNLIDNFVTSPAFGNLLTGLMDLAEDVLNFIEKMEPAISAVVDAIGQVVGAAGMVFDAIKTAWDNLPAFLRDILSGKLVSAGATSYLKSQTPQELFNRFNPLGAAGPVGGLLSGPGFNILNREFNKALNTVEDIDDATGDIVQKTDEWQKKISFVESKTRGITKLQELKNQLLIEAIIYMNRISEELRWHAQYAEDIAKNWSQLTVGAAGFAGADMDWEDVFPETPPGGFRKNWGDAIGGAFADGFASALDNLGSFTQALQRGITSAASKGLELAFGTSFWGKIGSALGGSLIGSLLGGLFGGGKAKIDPKALALNWEDIFKEQIDAITSYIEKGVALTDKLLRDIEQSLTYHGGRWTDYIEDLSAAYDTQAEAIYNARNQLEGYHLQLMQGAAALFQYHKSLWELRRSIRETGLALRDLALGEGLRYTQPPGRGENIFGQAESKTWMGMQAYERLMADIKELPTNRFGQVRWGDAREMMGRVNPEAQELVLQMIEQMNQKGLLLTQIDNQQSQMKIARHQRDLLRNNLPIMRNRLERISEILTYMRNHWREEAPGGGGGGGKPGDWPDEPPRKAASTSTTNMYVSQSAPTTVVLQLPNGKELTRFVVNEAARDPEMLRLLERARQQQPGTQGARMRG